MPVTTATPSRDPISHSVTELSRVMYSSNERSVTAERVCRLSGASNYATILPSCQRHLAAAAAAELSMMRCVSAQAAYQHPYIRAPSFIYYLAEIITVSQVNSAFCPLQASNVSINIWITRSQAVARIADSTASQQTV